MTHKVFWDDPYQTRLMTTITRVEADRVWLAATIFYAFSGGQESDHGTIAGQPVLLAEKTGLDIAYSLPPEHGLQAGEQVEVVIDWPRRYRLMRLHFAAELTLETIYRDFPGVEKLGAHIAEDKARIDFALAEPITPHLVVISQQVQAIIDADLPIVSAFSDPLQQRRYWEVAGYSRVPCGGTHLRRTGEVGTLQLKRKNVGKGKERVSIEIL